MIKILFGDRWASNVEFLLMVNNDIVMEKYVKRPAQHPTSETSFQTHKYISFSVARWGVLADNFLLLCLNYLPLIPIYSAL